ncbi:ClpP-like prohead protease/major capsid protein fusion protein [Pelagovum pacificum]|uniref:Clp protease ClpP n=1 Tax=Pelagovum pacificum TaxID=2588711 RepID=A0A5C5GG41_9RHOB|nr:ClpP-like prohead protease/major capsid protein fusion protein [Pelagovum pacificum]QQA43950.1 Clp protease ClpP [Pelagovum pacificum]TNY32921.1 Clp protease ClpP [Pelagovum pacificum]
MPDNELLLYGTVGDTFWEEDYFTAAQVRGQLAVMSGPITVRINSGGGIASEGQAIYTMLVDYPGEVHVVVDGIALSSASLIAMAGDRITMRLGSWMLIHDPAQMFTDGRGTEDDHRTSAEHLRIIADAYADVYARRTGQTRERVRELMQAETVLNGEMAVELGFADDRDEETPAVTAAVFDFRMYRNAPRELREAAEALGPAPSRTAVLAMVAGEPRQKKDPQMTQNPEGATATAPKPATSPAPPANPTPPVADGATVTMSADDAVRAERTRTRQIMQACRQAGLEMSVADQHIASGTSLEAALDDITAKWQEKGDTDAPMTGAPVAHVGMESREKFVMGATKALMAKARLEGGERNEFSSLTLSEMARESIEMAGERVTSRDRREMVGRALTMAGMHTTSDFANILADVASKAALQGWNEAEETYPLWTRAGSLSDFKPSKRVGLGLVSALEKIGETGEYKYGTVGDRGEEIVLGTYGKIIAITRQAIINDDLMMLGDLPRRMGRAARRTVGNLVYAVLTTNPNMSDGKALFHADHNNLGSAGAPSVSTLGAARAAMRTQKDPGDPKATLNISPRYMLVPATLETATRQLLTSTVDPTSQKGHATNPVNGMAELIVDGRLDAASTTAWYLAADPSAYDTIEVAYLDGNDTPYLEEKTGWTVDGVELKVRMDAGVAPLAYQTLYKNPGQ